MGQLVIVGAGISALAHLTQEAAAAIAAADVVFYHATTGVMAAMIQDLNPACVDLYAFYGEAKTRRTTYVQMAELMLREVRAGRRVAGVFHGHAGFFVMAARRSMAIAEAEGHGVRMLPGVSSVDCLLADLRIDPGVVGMQIVKAGSYLRGKSRLEPSGHVVFLQIASVGDTTFSYSGYKQSQAEAFLERLIGDYGCEQEAVYYQAALFPGLKPVIQTAALSALLHERRTSSFGPGILYLPPKGETFSAVLSRQNFRGREPYDDAAREAIAALDTHRTPTGFRQRFASDGMLGLMKRLAGSWEDLMRFERGEAAGDGHALTPDEREALRSRSMEAIRAVTTVTHRGEAD